MKKILLSAMLLVGISATAQVKIGDNPTVPHPSGSALLEMESTNKGMLLPRVALTATNNFAPLTAHVAGMTVYNTATAGTAPNNVVPGTYYNDGIKWIKVAESVTPKTTTLMVFVDQADPNTAGTNFDDVRPTNADGTPNTSFVNDDLLKQVADYLYMGNDGSSWLWDGTAYVSYQTPATTPWLITPTQNVDAAGDKTSMIWRSGAVAIAKDVRDASTNEAIMFRSTQKNFVLSTAGTSQAGFAGQFLSLTPQQTVTMPSTTIGSLSYGRSLGIAAGVTNSSYIAGALVEGSRNAVSGDDGTLSGGIRSIFNNYGHRGTATSGTGTSTTVYGYIGSPIAHYGTITNMYDIYVGNIAGTGTVTNKFGVYIAGSDKNHSLGGSTLFQTNSTAAGLKPDVSAVVEARSTTKGFLAPRMTTTQRDAIVTPATGLQVYNITTKRLQINTGTTTAPVWNDLGGANEGMWKNVASTGTDLEFLSDGVTLRSADKIARFHDSGRLQLGTSSTAGNRSKLYLQTVGAFDGSTTVNGIYNDFQPGVMSANASLIGNYNLMRFGNTTANTSSIYGSYNQVFRGGATDTGAFSNIFGNYTWYGHLASDATATTNNLYGYYAAPRVDAGTVTTSVDFYAAAATIGATASITNQWGVYIGGIDKKNYFAGALGIGTTSALGEDMAAGQYKLRVTGADAEINGIRFGRGKQNGGYNIAVGPGSVLENATGNYNIAIGRNAMPALTTGTGNTAIGGYESMKDIVDGASNTAVGMYALRVLAGASSTNTAIGRNAGYTLTTGDENVFVGNNAGYYLTTGSNNIAVGAGTTNFPDNAGSNQLNIGNSIFATNLGSTSTNTFFIGANARTFTNSASGNHTFTDADGNTLNNVVHIGTGNSANYGPATVILKNYGNSADGGIGQIMFSNTRYGDIDGSKSDAAAIKASREGSSSGHNLRFYTSTTAAAGNTEKMRIAANGNVGIGTTNPNSTAKLEVNGGVKIGAVADTGAALGTIRYNSATNKFQGQIGVGQPGADANGWVDLH